MVAASCLYSVFSLPDLTPVEGEKAVSRVYWSVSTRCCLRAFPIPKLRVLSEPKIGFIRSSGRK